MKTTLKLASLIVGLVIVATVALLAFGLPASSVNAILSERVARDSGAKLSVAGAARIGLFPLHLTLHDVTALAPSDPRIRLTIERAEVAIALASLLTGAPEASSVTLTRPVLYAPLLRERTAARPGAPAASAPPAQIPLKNLSVREAAVVLSDPAAKVEQRADGIFADISFAPDRSVTIAGRAQFGDKPASFNARTRLPAASDRQSVPFELSFDAPGVMRRSLTAAGDVKIAGALVSLSNLSGQFGGEPFNGWASADLSSKPVLKLDLDFPRLSFEAPQWRDDGGATGWSTVPFDLSGLNYADAQARLSIAELKVGTLRVAPAPLDLTLGSGALKWQATKLGVGDGEIDGEMVIDASAAVPDLSLRADITDVRARPLLSSLAGFARIDGRLSAKLLLRGAGQHPKALAGAVGGTAFVAIRDGEIVGVNLAQMIRTLTGTTLDGWQANAAETTDLSQLSASFRIERGQGTTSDLMLAGPLVRMTGAGNVDLLTETMAFRVDPKLVMSLQGQSAPGSASPAPTPVGLGVPVIVQGPWASPRIYPEISGILDNPGDAYARLRQMGQGLFGRDLLGKDLQGLIGSGASGQGGDIGQAIGTIIQGLGAGQSSARPSAPADAAPPPDVNAPSPMNDIMKRLFGR